MKRSLLLFAVTGLLIGNTYAQTSWNLQTNPLGSGETGMVGKIQYVSPVEGWISTGNGKLLHTTDGGSTWTVVSPEPTDTLFSWSDPAVSMSFVSPSTGWIIRTKGSFSQWNGAVVYKTTNGGTNWNRVTIPSFDAGMYIQFVDANNGWILVFNTGFTSGGIFRTTDGGTSWGAIYPPVGGFPFFVNSTTGWIIAAGASGLTSDSISRTTNGGLTWTTPWGTNAQVSLNSIHFSDVSNGWVVGRNGVILRTTNGGTSWSYITNAGINSTYNCKAVFAYDANRVWIGTKADGSNIASVLHTTNGGASWSSQATPLEYSIFSIDFYDAQNGGLTADYGGICHTTTGGIASVENEGGQTPIAFQLGQNFPNPFNPSSSIRYALPRTSFVTLNVYNTLGQQVSQLVNEQQQVGYHDVVFRGDGLASGVYFYRIQAGDFVASKKLLLLK
jgi:photosystem II stability/assembly factor-like uncharacterized protein